MTDDTMTIGEMCRAFDVTPRALRFYEQKELLNPIREGQNRFYTPRDRARLKLILRGKRFGFSLAEIRDLLELYHLGDGQITQLSATLEAAERHHADLTAKRDELATAITELEQQIQMIRKMLAERSNPRSAAE
ncbi:MerR family DNA-binding transcriptional regulator [Limibaculum sp. M0105]|uniref:MerR family DNA-binding transcriptional regulator n=1 Tax=Thermohalobaculum xanthum TaxID=2753746 RepID=A0A8J7M914_9RHOB|nr:MerR family DNA-binding transcriptional regulator [Thermohalobaculum xanthum]MBK0399963.1 MerR family DNA-binding transcriptional regulator [Thermohalobaculum xanthum]